MPRQSWTVLSCLVSQLVINHVRYRTPPISVRVDRDGSAGLRITVSDGGTSDLPTPHRAGEDDESGGLPERGSRGMALIDDISADEVIEAHQEGKTV